MDLMDAANTTFLRRKKRLKLFSHLDHCSNPRQDNSTLIPRESNNPGDHNAHETNTIRGHAISQEGGSPKEDENSPSNQLPSLSQLIHHPPTNTPSSSSNTLPPRRILRTRKPAQLKPYTIETKRYVSKLNHNGWEDAVVRLPAITPVAPPSSADHQPYSSDPLDLIQNHDPSTPEDSQIGQFCLRKFHHRRRRSNDPLLRRKNHPRRTEQDSTHQGPSPRSDPQHVYRSKLIPADFASQPSSRRPSLRHLPLQTSPHLPSTLQNPSLSNSLPHIDQSQSSLANPTSSPSIVFPTRSSPLPSPSAITKPRHKSKQVLPPNPHRGIVQLDPDPHPFNSEKSKSHSSEEEDVQTPQILRKKVKLKLLNRMMPRVYVTQAEKDLKLMEQEKRAGKLKLTIDSDSSSQGSHPSPPQQKSARRFASHESLSVSSLPREDLNVDLHARTENFDPPHHPSRQYQSDLGSSASGQTTNAEEEEEGDQTPEILHPKKVKLKLLNRMMPRVYVTKAEKDLKLMEQEKRAGKLKLTIDSDSSSQGSRPSPARRKSTKRVSSGKSLPMPNSSEEDLNDGLHCRGETLEPPNYPSRPKEPSGMTWGVKMCMRMNRTSSSTSQLFNSHRTLERSVSSVSSRVSQSSSSRAARVVSQLRSKTDSSISLKDDHALWKTYESANGRPALNLPPPGYRRENHGGKKSALVELPQAPIWTFKDFTPDFGINRLPPGLTISSQIEYLKNGHISEFIKILDGTTQYTIVEPYRGFDHLFSPFMPIEEWQASLSLVSDRLQDELSAWLAVDSGRSKDALLDTSRWFQFLTNLISSVELNEDLIDPMVEWIQDLTNRFDDLAVDAVNRPEFSNLMLVVGWGIFEVVCRLDLRRRRSISWETHQSHQAFLNLGHQSICNLLRRLLEYGPPVTMGKIKSYTAEEDLDVPLFDVSVELWAALLNIILTPVEDVIKLEYLAMDDFWINFEESLRLHSQKIELSQMAHGEAICYLTMMICCISQISSTGVTIEEPQISSHWSVLVDSLGQLPENILGETVEVRMRERRDRYVRTLFSRILIFHERWDWQLRFDDGMIERLYKIMNGGRLERLSIEVGEMSHRFGSIDSFPNVLNDIDQLQAMMSAEEIGYGLNTNLRQDDSCFGMFLKILVIGFKSLPRPIETTKQKEIEKIISRSNPLRQLSFRPVRELGPIDLKISDQNRTALINHSSLFLIYSILFPSTIKRQWSFLEGLYNFSLIDHPARSTHFKILVKFAKFLKPTPNGGASRNPVDKFHYLTIVIKKLTINFETLKVEYSKLKERQMIIQERLNPTHSGPASSTTHHLIPSAPREIFKKNSVEESNLKMELNELKDLIGSRVRLIIQIFDSLIDLFEFFLMDTLSHPQDDTEDRLIYPPIFWLDSIWSAGLEESGLIKEKDVMSAFNEFLWNLLDGRQKKMKYVLEYSRQVRVIEEIFKKNQRDLECIAGVVDPEEEVLQNEELLMEKKELEEKIESIHKLDQEWIGRLNQCSIYQFLQKSALLFIHGEQEEDFFSVGVKLIRSLGWIDRLKNQIDANFNWMENFKIVERHMGFGISTITSTPSTTNQNQLQKSKNRLKLMSILMTSLMTYLISNLEACRDEPPPLPPLHQDRALVSLSLSKIYRGKVRLEILKIWIYSLTFLEFTVQFRFTLLIFELENSLHQDSGVTNEEEGDFLLKFLPDSVSFSNWLRDHMDSSSLQIGPTYSYQWWELSQIELEKSSLFESKRAEFFNLIFNEMKKELNQLMMNKDDQAKMNLKKTLNFYKKIIADLSESISNLNRILNLQTHQPFQKTKAYNNETNLIEKKFKKWKLIIKSIIQTNFGLLDPSLTTKNCNQDAFRDPRDGLVNLNYFFNFSSLNQLRLLKSILGLS